MLSFKLAIGTAQFGLHYGISNNSGKVSQENVAGLLSYAKDKGINTLDTAVAYGDSEQVLGNVGVDGWEIITKLPALPEGKEGIESWVDRQIDGSLGRLGVNRVYGLLLHRPQQLFEPSGQKLISALDRLKQQGIVKKIGVSIYQPEELDLIYKVMDLDLVQSPLNILDRRLIDSGWLARLKALGVEVHARSVFMQGLLLMSPAQRPEKFARWQSIWNEWNRWLISNEIDPIVACLAFALSESAVDKIVVGVENSAQLESIIRALGVSLPRVPASISSQDLDLLHPARW
ncbi:MAG: aldo/keto reductase [Pseudomonadales bacterium]